MTTDDIRAAAERLIDRATHLQVEYGDQNRWANDVMLVGPAALAGLDMASEIERLQSGYRQIVESIRGLGEGKQPNIPEAARFYFRIIESICDAALAEHEEAEAPTPDRCTVVFNNDRIQGRCPYPILNGSDMCAGHDALRIDR